MKKFLLGLYFGIVVLLSISARASDMYIQKMDIDHNSHVVEVIGNFSTPCVTQPTPKLVPTDEPDTFELKIAGTDEPGVCILVLGPTVALAVDFKAIKYEIESFGRSADKEYRIINKAAGFDETIDFSQAMIAQKFSTETVIGSLMEKDGQYFILTNGGQQVEAISPFIELASLSGEEVFVFGHVGSADIAENSFLLSNDSNVQFLVTGISTAVR